MLTIYNIIVNKVFLFLNMNTLHYITYKMHLFFSFVCRRTSPCLMTLQTYLFTNPCSHRPFCVSHVTFTHTKLTLFAHTLTQCGLTVLGHLFQQVNQCIWFNLSAGSLILLFFIQRYNKYIYNLHIQGTEYIYYFFQNLEKNKHSLGRFD